MSAYSLRSAWDESPRHPWDMQVARCSECRQRVGTWLEDLDADRVWAKPCGCEQTFCRLPEPYWALASDGKSLRWRFDRIPLVAADGTVS